MKSLRVVGGLALVVIALTMVPATAHASQNAAHRTWLRSDAQTQSGAAGGSSHGTIGRSLALIALLAVAGYFVWRKVNKKGAPSLPSRPHVRVLSGTVVGPKARAVVAEVGGRFILLGVTEQSVRRLAWLDSLEAGEREDDTRGNELPRLADVTPRSNATHSRPSAASLVAQRSESRTPKFSDLLRDAVGIKPKHSEHAAVELAATTRDRLTLSAGAADAAHDTEYMNIEGQAAGLVSRLNRKK